MKIDLRKLFIENIIKINEQVTVPEDYFKNTDIIKMDPLKVTGTVFLNYDDNIETNLLINGTFILPCSISLEEVRYDFSTEVNEVIKENDDNNELTLELLDILWENTVLEVPIKVTKPDAVFKAESGNGWELQ